MRMGQRARWGQALRPIRSRSPELSVTLLLKATPGKAASSIRGGSRTALRPGSGWGFCDKDEKHCWGARVAARRGWAGTQLCGAQRARLHGGASCPRQPWPLSWSLGAC